MKKGDLVEHMSKDFGIGIVMRTYSNYKGYHAVVRWSKAIKDVSYHYEQLQKVEQK